MANQIKTLPTKPELNFKFTDTKDRRMISIRLPEALLTQIKKIAQQTGWTKTELIQFALDQFAQAEGKKR
jgi:predicted DNA binding CopG/RHH family protein